MNLRDSRYWDRELEGGLPDSRLGGTARERTALTLAGIEFHRVFCANCGTPQGAVTAETVAHAFVLCEECETAMRPPSLPRGVVLLSPEQEARVRSGRPPFVTLQEENEARVRAGLEPKAA